MPRCIRCPWEAGPAEQFCALCGVQLATCEVYPRTALEGLLFYPSYPGEAGHALYLENRGTVSTTASLQVPSNFKIQHGERRAGRLNVQLEPGDKTEILIRSEARFTAGQVYLEIKSPVIKHGVTRIPLLVSEEPTFQVRHENIRLTRQGRPADLFPSNTGECRWQLVVLPRNGAAILREVAVIGEANFKTTDLGEGRLLQKNQQTNIELIWDNPPDHQMAVQLQLVSDGFTPQAVPIVVHPRAAITLRDEVRSAFGDHLVIGARPQRLYVKLWNAGFKRARLLQVEQNTPGVTLSAARVMSNADDRTGLEYPCVGGLLTPQAQVTLVDQGGRLNRVDPWLEELVFEVSPAAQVNVKGGVLKIDLVLGLEVSEPVADEAEDGQTPPHREGNDRKRVRRGISVATKPLRALSCEEGLLCIDYGTVHTCVAYEVDGQLKMLTLEDHQGQAEGAGEQFKSAYQVESWTPPKLKFGDSVWENISRDFVSTDYAAKLRLGTTQLRSLRDTRGELRRVSGVDAASTLIAEVLERVKERTGLDFKRVRLSKPAAFDEASTRDLQAAVMALGFDERCIETPISEPEAYLTSLTSNDAFINNLRKQDKPGAHATVGMVLDLGGGTTDVTIFEYDQDSSTIDIIASHGYRWLGGEMLTHQMAHHLYKNIQNRSDFPFPEIIDGEPFDIASLDGADASVAGNFNELRNVTERIKCGSRLLEGKAWNISPSLFDKAGIRRNADIKVTPGNAKSGLAQVAWRLVGRAIDDTLTRCARMREHRILSASTPQLVVLAGNGAKLWTLKNIVNSRLKDAGVSQAAIFADKKSVKTGVVYGLASGVGGAGRVRISPRLGSGSWWYVRIGTEFVLAKPAGAAFGGIPDEHRRPLGGCALYMNGHIDLAYGAGPKERLGPAEATQLTISHIVDPETLRGQRVFLAFEFASDGSPGLWLKTEEESWRWHPARERGVA